MLFQTVQNKKILEVFVDKGMREGHTVTFNGEADQEFGKDPGDVQIGNALYFEMCSTNNSARANLLPLKKLV